MTITASQLESLIEADLSKLSDARVTERVRSLLVPPRLFSVPWNYGPPGAYPCWLVLRDEETDSAVLYSEHGFGPRSPWGIAFIGTDRAPVSMGMDSGWFTGFLDAWFDSFSATRLPIWRVLPREYGRETPITEEMGWDEALKALDRLEGQFPGSSFEVGHTIAYGEGET